MRIAHGLIAAALTIFHPVFALADAAPPAVQAFITHLERQTGLKATYKSLKADGSGGAAITKLYMQHLDPSREPAIVVAVDSVNFSGVSEEAPSLYRVENASFSNIEFLLTYKGTTVAASAPQASAEGLYIRAKGDNPTPLEGYLASRLFARKKTVGKISISVNGERVSIDGMEGAWSGDPRTGMGTSRSVTSNIVIPETLVELADKSGMLKKLGYAEINLDIASEEDKRITGDKVHFSGKVSLTGKGIGSISFSGDIANIPLAVYAALLRTNKEGKEPDLTNFKPQIQNIALNGASLRFEDASIVNKVLKMAAAMQGTDENTLRASIGPMVQLALVQMQNEAFTKQVTDAVTAFMAAPKSLTLTARPGSAVTFSDLSAMDPNKPGDAINRLGLTVTAND